MFTPRLKLSMRNAATLLGSNLSSPNVRQAPLISGIGSTTKVTSIVMQQYNCLVHTVKEKFPNSQLLFKHHTSYKKTIFKICYNMQILKGYEQSS